MKKTLFLIVLIGFGIIFNFSTIHGITDDDIQKITERLDEIEQKIDGDVSNKDAMFWEILAGVIVGIVISTVFFIIEKRRKDREREKIDQKNIRNEEKKSKDEIRLKEKEIKCLKEFNDSKYPEGRSELWLRLETGMSDEQFYNFFTKYNKNITKWENDGKIMFGFRDKEELKNVLKKEEERLKSMKKLD